MFFDQVANTGSVNIRQTDQVTRHPYPAANRFRIHCALMLAELNRVEWVGKAFLEVEKVECHVLVKVASSGEMEVQDKIFHRFQPIDSRQPLPVRWPPGKCVMR